LKKYLRKILFWINIVFAIALLGSYASNYFNPEYFWYFAFIGLAYPVLLIINIAFSVFWIWRKKWYFLLSVLVILTGISNIGKIIQIRLFDRTGKIHGDVRILSYNVRLFNYYEWEKSRTVRDSILHYIAQQGANIICFQEYMTTSNIPQYSEKYIDTVLKSYPYKHVFYTSKTSEYSNYGIATYSEYPIIKKNSIQFKNSFNSCIYSDISIGDDTIRFFNVHLQSVKLRKENYLFVDSMSLRLDSKRMSEVKDISGQLKLAYIKRAQQVDELSWYIRKSPYRVVVCGDFNDTPISYTYKRVRGDLADAFIGSGKGAGNTYRGISPSFRIDYIFHSKSIKSSNYRTHSIGFSDHYPISCELSMNP
jgi:endonuclease/exonuclease/phosphatase family metal-dependent hydrolase